MYIFRQLYSLRNGDSKQFCGEIGSLRLLRRRGALACFDDDRVEATIAVQRLYVTIIAPASSRLFSPFVAGLQTGSLFFVLECSLH